MKLSDLPPELPWYHLHAEYLCAPDASGRQHAHSVDWDISEGGIEEAAIKLGEAIGLCNQDRHDGHGHAHAAWEADAAFLAAFEQLKAGEANREYKRLLHKIRLHQQWGGPVPEAVIMPGNKNPEDWEIWVTDHQTGMPVPYRALGIDLPDPRELGARRNPIGGWTFPKEKRNG